MARNGIAKVEIDEAQTMLDKGASVLSVALHFRVAPQAIYELIQRGRLSRPASSTA